MTDEFMKQLTDFNRTYKELNEIYHAYAVAKGISDSTLWLIYSLYNSRDGYTQRELCSDWSYSPQTVNSSLKNLERQGIVKLCYAEGSRKNKGIFLTESGKKFAEQIAAPLIAAEQSSFAELDEAERDTLISLTEKHIRLLRAKLKKTE